MRTTITYCGRRYEVTWSDPPTVRIRITTRRGLSFWRTLRPHPGVYRPNTVAEVILEATIKRKREDA